MSLLDDLGDQDFKMLMKYLIDIFEMIKTGYIIGHREKM
jgi:hypothetical protein